MDIYTVISMLFGAVIGILASYALMAKLDERRRRLKDKFGYKFEGSGVITKRVVNGKLVTTRPLLQTYSEGR